MLGNIWDGSQGFLPPGIYVLIYSPTLELGWIYWLMNRIWQKWDGISLLRVSYKITWVSILFLFSDSLTCLCWWKPDSILWVGLQWQGAEEDGWSRASWDPHPTAYEELNSAINYMSGLGSGSSFSGALRWLQLWTPCLPHIKELKAQNLTKLTPISDPWNLWDNRCLVF